MVESEARRGDWSGEGERRMLRENRSNEPIYERVTESGGCNKLDKVGSLAWRLDNLFHIVLYRSAIHCTRSYGKTLTR